MKHPESLINLSFDEFVWDTCGPKWKNTRSPFLPWLYEEVRRECDDIDRQVQEMRHEEVQFVLASKKKLRELRQADGQHGLTFNQTERKNKTHRMEIAIDRIFNGVKSLPDHTEFERQIQDTLRRELTSARHKAMETPKVPSLEEYRVTKVKYYQSQRQILSCRRQDLIVCLRKYEEEYKRLDNLVPYPMLWRPSDGS